MSDSEKKPRRRWLPRWVRRTLIIGGIVLLAAVLIEGVVLGVIWRGWFRPPFKLVIAPETTYLTGPIQSDGTIDYVAALNARYGAGVTAENNAAIPLIRALGKSFIRPDRFAAVCAELGVADCDGRNLSVSDDALLRLRPELAAIATRPATGPASLPATTAAKRKSKPKDARTCLYEQLNETWKRPWRAEEFPVVVELIKANEPALELLVQASRRARYYVPFASPTRPRRLADCAVPLLASLRDTARLLHSRAMLRLGSGEVREPIDDLIALARLGQLLGQSPVPIERLLGKVHCSLAGSEAQWVVEKGALTAGDARRLLAGLAELRYPSVADAVELCDRFTFLDAVSWAASTAETADKASNLPRGLKGSAVDWNRILRRWNEWYNQQRRCFAPSARDGAWAAATSWGEQETRAMVHRSRLRYLHDPTLLTSDYLFTCCCSFASTAKAEWQAAIEFRMHLLQVALAGYRAEQGKYPQTLAELAGPWLPAALADLPKSVTYTRTEAGYRLFHPGWDGKPDAGRKDGDDLVIELPRVDRPARP